MTPDPARPPPARRGRAFFSNFSSCISILFCFFLVSSFFLSTSTSSLLFYFSLPSSFSFSSFSFYFFTSSPSLYPSLPSSSLNPSDFPVLSPFCFSLKLNYLSPIYFLSPLFPLPPPPTFSHCLVFYLSSYYQNYVHY